MIYNVDCDGPIEGEYIANEVQNAIPQMKVVKFLCIDIGVRTFLKNRVADTKRIRTATNETRFLMMVLIFEPRYHI